MTTAYFTALADELRALGVPADRVTATVDELATFADDGTTDPAAEFGAPAQFAAQLAPRAENPEAPGASEGETWRWSVDAFQDVRLLNVYGDEGWELERVDGAGRFVSHRDPSTPLRWEYHREAVLPQNREDRAEQLAPDGWELCGRWVYFDYYKRPKSASDGPSATVASPPSRPERRAFWSRWFKLFIAVYVLLAVTVATLALTTGQGGGFVKGIGMGVLIGTGMAFGIMHRQLTRRT